MVAEGYPGLRVEGSLRENPGGVNRHHCLKRRGLWEDPVSPARQQELPTACVRTNRALGTVGVVVILAAWYPSRDVSRKQWETWALSSDLSPGSQTSWHTGETTPPGLHLCCVVGAGWRKSLWTAWRTQLVQSLRHGVQERCRATLLASVTGDQQAVRLPAHPRPPDSFPL